MRVRWIALCLLMCISAAASSQAKDPNPLFPIMNDEVLWGYIDRTGKVVIEPKFDGADYFSEGLAPIKSGFGEATKYGFIDKTGKIVIEPRFREVQGFSDGLAAVSVVEERWGYIDETGKFVIQPRKWWPGDFRNGRARMVVDTDAYSAELLCIDKTGNVIVREPVPGEGSQSFGAISPTGKLRIDKKALPCLDFHEGLAAVPNTDEYARIAYVNEQGKVVIPPKFRCAQDFSEGLAAVQLTDESGFEALGWGYIDKNAKMVIELECDQAESFSDGLALVRTYGEQEQVDTVDGDSWARSEYYKFIDKTGKTAIDLSKYHYAESFRDGLARVWIVSPELGGAPSYIDKTGKFIWKAE